MAAQIYPGFHNSAKLLNGMAQEHWVEKVTYELPKGTFTGMHVRVCVIAECTFTPCCANGFYVFAVTINKLIINAVHALRRLR